MKEEDQAINFMFLRRFLRLESVLTILMLLCVNTGYANEDEEQDLQQEESGSPQKKKYDDAFFTGRGTQVVVNKLYEKQFKSEILLNGVLLPFGSVFKSYGGGIGYQFHFNDNWGWEAIHAQFYSTTLSNFSVTEFESQPADPTQPLPDNEKVRMNLLKATYMSNVFYNAVYGKLRLLGFLILRYDFYALLGVGVAQTTQRVTNNTLTPFAVSFGMGGRFFFSKYAALRLELRDTFYTETFGNATSTYTQRKNNFMMLAGVSFFLPGFERTDSKF